MTQITLSDGRKIEVSHIITRRISSTYQALMFKHAKASVGPDGKPTMDMSMEDINAATDYLISALTGLSIEEIGNLPISDFNLLDVAAKEIESKKK